MSDTSLLTDLQGYADAQIKKHAIPAVSLAVWQNGNLHQAVAGTLNVNTGAKVTPDSIFQIGSITKVMTACLIMQLVEEGRLELNTPVIHYLPDFRLANDQATTAITVRQLINHTSGMAGDLFYDDNHHQGNLIARFVDRCSLLPTLYPAGEMYSYCNSAFVVAGRLVEVVRGISWYQAVEDFIFSPLGMEHAIADPKDVVSYSIATGHMWGTLLKEELAEAKTNRWITTGKSLPPYTTLGMAPAGATVAMSVADLITFARAHLDGGCNAAGDVWLTPESVKAMQNSTIQLPRISSRYRKAIGLGWHLHHYPQSNLHMVGHTGGTRGFASVLQLIPEQQTAYAILLNSTGGNVAAFNAINRDLMLALTGTEVQHPDPDHTTADTDLLQGMVGKYSQGLQSTIEISMGDGQLAACMTFNQSSLAPMHMKLKWTEENCFAVFSADGQYIMNAVFLPDEKGDIAWYLNGEALYRRC